MNLKILLPSRVFCGESHVDRLVVQTSAGSFGLLMHRADCVAAIVPGILVYQVKDQNEVFVALDQGVLTKAAADVFISVRNAIAGSNLDELKKQVEDNFLKLSDEQQTIHTAMVRMETRLIAQLVASQHG